MFLSKLKAVAAVAVLAGVLGTGVGVATYAGLRADTTQAAPGASQAATQPAPNADRMRLLQEYARVNGQIEAQKGGIPFAEAVFVQKELNSLAAMTPEQQERYWQRLPSSLRQLHRQLDPFHVTAEDRAAAAKVPPDVAAEIARLLSDDVNAYLASRRRVLAYGPGCLALVAEQAQKLPADAAHRLRLLAVFNDLEDQVMTEQRLRVAAEVARRAEQIVKARGRQEHVKIATLISRRLTNDAPHHDPYREACYFDFTHGKNSYRNGASLEFETANGDDFLVRMVGGQHNRIKDLGPVDFAAIKAAPPARETATWGPDGRRPIPAVVGHVYLEHCLQAWAQIDTVVKFKVLDIKPGAWVILEYQVLGPPGRES